MPSLGVIVRLFSFTGGSPGTYAQGCDGRKEPHHYAVIAFSALLQSHPVKVPDAKAAGSPREPAAMRQTHSEKLQQNWK
jgi:hypothetical protein